MTGTNRTFAWPLAITAWSYLTPHSGFDDAVTLLAMRFVAWALAD